MNKVKLFIAVIASLVPLTYIKAEPYVSASLGWTFNQKLKSISGDENFSYGEDVITPGTYIEGTHYSDIKLKDALQGGLKTGYFLESYPSLGIELEANYSQPNMKKQNVTLSSDNPYFAGIIESIGGTLQNNATENQLPAKVKLFQFNLNGLYRYQGFGNLIPYIGGGPSLNVIKISGTGESGHFVDPVCGDVCVSNAGNIHDTSVNIGANFKIGAEYKIDKAWGLGAEYHYNWVPIDISHFRSANNLNADLEMQSVNLVLTRHF